MQGSRFQKIIIGVLIFSQITFWPALVFAQTATIGAINPIPISNSGSVVGNAAFNLGTPPLLGMVAIQTLYNQCTAAMKTFEATDNTIQLGFSFSTLISGGGALAESIGNEIAAYNTYLTCLIGPVGPQVPGAPFVMPALSALTAPNSYTANLKQQLVSQVNASIQTYQAKLKTAQARYNVASQNIWKALMITILINTTKTVADQLVNRLVTNYKITNLKQYTDSVATLMYDNQFLRDNFPDAQGQMMARQILTNPLFRSQIQPGIYAQANNNLGYNPSTLSPSDPNYYTKLAAAGSSPANPYFLQTAYVSGVDQSHNTAITTAQAQISQGNGYKAPVNCAGSLAQQQQIDSQTASAQALINNRQGLLTSLQNGGGSASDIKKAQADLTAAQNAWNNLPYTVAGQNSLSATANGGSGAEGNAAIIMCEAVASPAVLVNQGIDAVFKSLNLGQYNNSNLPGFLSSISSMATQIGSSLVLGGIGAASPQSVTLNENQAITNGITATVGAAAQTFSNNAQANLANGIDFYGATNLGVPNGYEIYWTVVTTQIPTASYVTITGPGINGVTGHLPLSGNYPVVSPSVGTYLLTVYNIKAQVITSASFSTDPEKQQNLSYNPSGPTVAGAFTDKPSITPRGPAVTIEPRGN